MTRGELDLDGRRFRLVCVRQTGVAVYRGDGAYLRVGDGAAGELEVHRQMLHGGYPVAEILEVGDHLGSPYYIETDLGADTFGDSWADRLADGGCVPARELARFHHVMRRHARAQLSGVQRSVDLDELAEFVGVDGAVAHNPELAVPIRAAWEEATSLLGGLPATLQHGDLHPFNICPRGIIDLEGAGWAPIAYDVATAVLEPTLAEPRWQDGALSLGWFTPEQVRAHLEMVDRELAGSALPAPSTRIHAHVVCRAINLCSRVHRDPSIWEARRDMLGRVLPAFLESGRVPLAWEG